MFSTSKFLVNPPSTVVTDPYFRYTTLLLNDTGTNGAQNNTFIAANYGAVSAVGGYAGYFDGTGAYLSTPNVAALRLGAGDFTVESWIYPFRITNTYTSAICGTYGYVSSADRGWAFYLNSTGYLSLVMFGSSGSGFTLASSTITPNNSWSHVAAVRSGTTVTLYLNGVSVATGTSSKDEDYSVVNFNIATLRADNLSPATGNAGQSFQGYLNNLRIVKGTAVYTGNFTPPTSPLTAISGTSLLTCQSATFVDNSPNNFPLTVNGNAVVSTASNSGMVITRNGNTTQGSFNPYMPTGYWSGYFDGNGDYLQTSSAVSAGTGDFTVECWIYTNSTADQNIATRFTGNNQFRIGYNSIANSITLIVNGSIVIGSAGTAVTPNVWHHVAAVRQGTTCRVYVDGVQQGTGTSSSTFALEIIGGYFFSTLQNPFNGYISNFRFITGTCLYPGGTTFTPPTTPLTAITNTSLLCLQNNRFKDNSSNNFTITRNGDTKVTHFNPFAPPASYTTSAYGGSAYFDGSGDYLTIPYNSVFDFGTGDFTIECWFYPTSVTGYQMLCTKQPASTTALAIQLRLNNTALEFVSRSSNLSGTITLSGGTVSISSWNHAAIVKNSGTLILYLNGVSVATASSSNDLTGSYPFYFGVLVDPSLNYYFNGYISNARIVKGTAVYTANFTPPTAPLTAISGTSLLLNATNAGIYDATTLNDIETVADAKVSTAQAKWGSSSMFFDGTGDYLYLPKDTELDMGSGNFTIEWWMYPTTTSQNATASIIASGNTTWSTGAVVIDCGSNAANKVRFVTYPNGVAVGDPNAWTVNTWTYFAVVRNGNTLTLYRNGTSVATNTSFNTWQPTVNFNYNNATKIAGGHWDGATSYFTGYIEDLRITKGIARYTSNFTAPTAAFPTR